MSTIAAWAMYLAAIVFSTAALWLAPIVPDFTVAGHVAVQGAIVCIACGILVGVTA